MRTFESSDRPLFSFGVRYNDRRSFVAMPEVLVISLRVSIAVNVKLIVD